MRVEINLPDDEDFKTKIQALAKSNNRTRKNWIETVIIALVNETNPVLIKPDKKEKLMAEPRNNDKPIIAPKIENPKNLIKHKLWQEGDPKEKTISFFVKYGCSTYDEI